MAKRRIIAAAVGLGIVVGGYTIMELTVPKKDELMQKMSSDLTNSARLGKIEKRNQQLMQVIQKNIDSDDPVWKLKSLDDRKTK